MDTIQASKKRFPSELLTMSMLVVIVWGLWAGQAFFIPISLAGLLAFLASPLVRLMMRAKLPEWVAILITAVLMVLPVAFVGYMLIRQAQSLMQDYPSIVAAVQRGIQHLSDSAIGKKFHLQEHLTVASLGEKVSSGAGEGIQFLVKGLRTAFEAGTESVLIFLFAVIMLASREHLYQSSEKILSRFESIESARVLEAVTKLIEQFLITKMIVIVIISLSAFGVLQIMGIKYAFLLGMITGVLTLIPEVGFAVSLVPIVVVAFATGHSVGSTLVAVAGMVVIHLVEANILTPKLVGKQLNLNVLSSFVGLFAGGLLWGVWGMLLSIPILGVLRIVLSTTPTLQPWAFLLSEREDKKFQVGLMSKALRSERLKSLLLRPEQA